MKDATTSATFARCPFVSLQLGQDQVAAHGTAHSSNCRVRDMLADTVKYVEKGYLRAYCQTCRGGTTLSILTSMLRKVISKILLSIQRTDTLEDEGK